MERSTKIEDIIKPTCFFLFGIYGYSGSGECISPDKECTDCWVNKRRLPNNPQNDKPDTKKNQAQNLQRNNLLTA